MRGIAAHGDDGVNGASGVVQMMIFKLCARTAWEQAQETGVYTGAPVDLADGFIHFSAPDQVQETAAKYFAFQDDLVLLAVDDAALGHSLVWEVSRGGALFPHLYRHLAIAEVVWAKPLPMRADGTHDFAGLL
jgi:uncharacterized protein (DUF952 family)